MKAILETILVAVLFVALSLAGVAILAATAIRTSAIANPIWSVLIKGSEFVIGTLWLLGVVYAATHLIVLIFAPKAPHRI